MNYCCTHPSVKCTKTKYGAFCPFGKVLEAGHFPAYDVDKFNVTGATPCHGQCYNDYQTSKHISEYSHYTCPDKCVHWSGMCRGVSWCEGDQEICGEDLRCPLHDGDGNSGNITIHTMATDPPRSYCFGSQGGFNGEDQVLGDLVKNDNGYDNLDRSDEDIQIETGSKSNINYTALEPCTDRDLFYNPLGHPGIKCGSACREIANNWC